MKAILFLLLTASFSFSQNREFSIKETDSICSLGNAYGHSDGKITIHNKKKEFIGNGGFSLATYQYHPDHEKFGILSAKEKRAYDLQKNAVLIKANYHKAVHYKNSYTENVYSEFYYRSNKPFYIRIKILRTEKNKPDLTEHFEYTKEELNNAKSIKNILLFDVQAWVREKNKEILDFYNKK